MTDKEQNQVFKQWLDNYRALLFKIVRAYAFTAQDRDDLFQEISLQVWRSIPNFRKESAVTTWLYRIALNTALRWKSKESQAITKDQDLDHPMAVLKAEPNPGNERIDWLYEQIGKLNEVDRSLCLMLLDDFSYKEMGNILGITDSNVAVKIHRIKKYLAEQYRN